jgi:triosephosphate isomerase
VRQQLGSNSRISVGAQNCSEHDSGAYTGETSVAMLKSMNIPYVIIGHSERRQYFGETNDWLAKKIDAVLAENLNPIYCVGETLEEREGNTHFEVLKSQISEGLFHLTAEQMASVVLAYEPVWAIGTGETASPDQAQEMHKFIRNLVEKVYGFDIANHLTILYGGSVKPDNAKEIFSKPDVDGGLIGGAALKAADFVAIVNGF